LTSFFEQAAAITSLEPHEKTALAITPAKTRNCVLENIQWNGDPARAFLFMATIVIFDPSRVLDAVALIDRRLYRGINAIRFVLLEFLIHPPCKKRPSLCERHVPHNVFVFMGKPCMTQVQVFGVSASLLPIFRRNNSLFSYVTLSNGWKSETASSTPWSESTLISSILYQY
jgi:hypothetical protein